MKKRSFILGISGLPASGKSSVLDILKRHGFFVIEADKVVHDLYKADGAGQRKIAEFFGEEYLRKDGSVNKNKLRRAVFSDFKKLKILNALIHPIVFSEIEKIVNSCDSDFVAIEAAYFEEKHLAKIVDRILYIERPRKKHMDALTENMFEVYPKPFRKDVIVKNNSTLKALDKKVIIALEKLKIKL